jgi:hypothetical protein
MRLFVLAALAVSAFVGSVTIDPTDANAVVCARGVARAGCVGAGRAAVVHHPVAVHPVAACRWVVVNGVRVRRCV